MRIVIVEDEIKTRQGLKNIIEKYTPHTVVASECEGSAGLKAVCEQQPDVVITDINMPNMDGITMLEEIRKRGIQTKAVLLTGYSDFEYARKSIQLGAEEYLLKPLNVEDIIEVLEKINDKAAKIEIERASKQQLLFSILTSSISKREEFEKQLEQQLHLQLYMEENISLFLLRTESLFRETINEMISVLKKVLPAVCLTRYYVFRLPDKQLALIMILDGQNVHYLKELFLMNVLPAANEIGECMVCYGEISRISELQGKLVKMQDYFQYGFALDKEQILDEEFVSACRFEEIVYPDNLEHLVRREIRGGKREKIMQAVKKFQNQVIDSSAEPKYIKEYTVRFLMAIVDSVRELKKSDRVNPLYHRLFENIMKCSTKEMLIYELNKMLETLFCEDKDISKTDNGMILNVIELIRTNYEHDISLSEAADFVGITPEYLSKLFAKEMGINFSTFLGEFRISVAKRLLLENKYKIYEVAEAIGYKDTKYFNKVFKSIVGVAPSEYRKMLR